MEPRSPEISPNLIYRELEREGTTVFLSYRDCVPKEPQIPRATLGANNATQRGESDLGATCHSKVAAPMALLISRHLADDVDRDASAKRSSATRNKKEPKQKGMASFFFGVGEVGRGGVCCYPPDSSLTLLTTRDELNNKSNNEKKKSVI